MTNVRQMYTKMSATEQRVAASGRKHSPRVNTN